MVKKKVDFIFLSSVILAVCVYAKIIPLPQNNKIDSLFYADEIAALDGTIVSNPVKISDRYYSALLKTKSCRNLKNSLSSCNGLQTVFIPSSLIEAHYPGKLFSKAENLNAKILPVEKGICFSASGKNSSSKTGSKVFIVEKINSSYFEKTFFSRIKKSRALCRIQFKRLMSCWGNAGSLLLALLTGSREYLEKSFSDSFKFSGLSHILALSGMHLTAISSLAGVIEKRTSLKKAGILIQFSVIILFVWFAGFSPSLLRAFISYVLLALCSLFNIKVKSRLSVLSCTFLIHSIISPLDLYNTGFLLSYGALSGILILSPLVNSFSSKYIPSAVSDSLSASISANCFTFPISIKTFGFFSPAGIICTLFISPVITLFLYSGIVLIILSFFFPPLSRLSSLFLNFLYTAIEKTVTFWSFIPVIRF
ncbi:MAG: ComEC/Rec2 family competence protein [Treponema sp.]